VKEKIIAKRYAEAFLGFAKETVGTERVVAELKNLKIILHSNPDFEGFLYNPEIATAEKCSVIDAVLGSHFSQETRQFLKLLLQKERITQINAVCDYVRMTYAHGEGVEAVLKTSYPLDLDLIQKIKSRLENKLQKKLNLYLELDADLLGGVQIRIGNMILDGSVKRQLEELKRQLKNTQVE
jgi:F-type H+-transporting ATPase subunit delta